MRMNVLCTSHGKHSDDKLAYAMAADLVENAANLTGQDALDMRKLENQLGEMLAPHFRKLANRENDGLVKNGHDHLFQPLHAHPEHAAEIEAEVMKLYEASPFCHTMDKEVATANVHNVVHKWVRDAQHMHRDWFAGHGMIGHHIDLVKHPDHDPNHEHVRRWFDLHQAPSPEAHRKALHEIATGETLA